MRVREVLVVLQRCGTRALHPERAHEVRLQLKRVRVHPQCRGKAVSGLCIRARREAEFGNGVDQA